MWDYSEFEKKCSEEVTLLSNYRRELADELKKGLRYKDGKNVLDITIYSLDETLTVWGFNEIDNKTLKEFQDKHELRLIKKTKTMSIETKDCIPVYFYVFVSNKKKYMKNTLCGDLTESDNSKLFDYHLDEPYTRKSEGV